MPDYNGNERSQWTTRSEFSPPYRNPHPRQISGPRYGDREDEEIGNYGRGGYYGLGYDPENYNQQRLKMRTDRWQNYHHGDEPDDGRGGWWDPDRRDVSRYASDKETSYLPPVHGGKGPQNYQRSDDRVRENISDRLTDDSFIDASDIEVTVDNCEVTLTGTVVSKDTKRRAEHISESVPGVKNVENRLRIK
jgi:hypothetical protein